jgi:CheY-like chemotaxis protein
MSGTTASPQASSPACTPPNSTATGTAMRRITSVTAELSHWMPNKQTTLPAATHRVATNSGRTTGASAKSLAGKAEVDRTTGGPAGTVITRCPADTQCTMPKVMVVDDDDDMRRMLTTFLEMVGFDVLTAVHGRDALDQLINTRPCLILLDLMMPVMDGAEFRRLQQQAPRLKDIPVVCVSARHDASEQAAALDVPVCIRKPFDLAEVSAAVRRYCPA